MAAAGFVNVGWSRPPLPRWPSIYTLTEGASFTKMAGAGFVSVGLNGAPLPIWPPRMLGWSGGRPTWSRRMEFAERHLRERGWRGKGLGRREDGISEPITVKVKCDKAGIGHRMGEQFTFHWWDHVFNKAAENVLVDTAEYGVRLRQAGSDTEQREDGPVTSKKPRKAQECRQLLYGRFIKSATLTPGTEGEVPVPTPSSDDSDSDEDEKLDLSSTTRLTDEELVRVCGGRTGHKGARHGVTMSAKLLRLEAQEREFLAKYRQEPAAGDGDGGGIETETGTERTKKKKRKKNKKKKSSPGGGDGTEEVGEVIVGGRGEQGRKRRKGRGREEEVEGEEKVQEEVEVEGEEEGEQQGEVTTGKRRKRRGREEEVEGEEKVQEEQQGEVTTGKRKKGRGREVEGEERLQGEVTTGKRKKGRRDQEGEVTTSGAGEGEAGAGQEQGISTGKRRKGRREEEEKERLQGEIPAEEIGEPQGGRPEGESGAGGRGKRGSRRRKAEWRGREDIE